MVWARSKGHQERKMQAILEQLKKDKIREGFKEMILNEFIKNPEFEYSDKNAIGEIMTKIKRFVHENRWSKTVKLLNEFKQLKQ